MNVRLIVRWLVVGGALSVACTTSAPSRFYVLTATASASGAPTSGASIVVGPVAIPGAVDRPQFVEQVTPNRVEVDDFNRWAAPLGESISRVVAANLAALLGIPEVSVAPFATFSPVYQVTIDVQRFESVPGESALVDALWTVREAGGSATRTGHTLSREPVQGEGFDALAAAHSRALASMSADIANVIRGWHAETP